MTSKGVALVTGAGQGIGKAIALRLADDGFDIAVNDIVDRQLSGIVDEIKTKGRKVSMHIADVSVEAQVQGMIENVVKEHGSLDVMVANAGICIWKSLVDTTEEEWDSVFTINAKGTFLCYKHAGRQMIAQGRGGRIIGASSIAGKRGSGYLSAYCGTKFAIRGLTQSAAAELGAHKITVNAYAPGGVDTDMREPPKMITRTTGGNSGDLYKSLKDRSAVGSTGTTIDIANLVSFLASKESQFITGQSISINGGIYFD